MKPYSKEVAKVIIKCRKDEFIVKKTGVFPKDDRPSSASEFEACTWRPACELGGQAGQKLRKKPGLPIPFDENDLAAFFMHGWGWFARDSFGSWDEGPDDAAFDEIDHLERGEVEDAVRGAFAAYRAAERVVGSYDTTYSEKIQELEKQCGPWLDAQEARERIKQAHCDADDYEAAWRKKMVNQLLVILPLSQEQENPTPALVLTEQAIGAGSEGAAPDVAEHDYSLLATPAELLDAFGKWGMKAAWFDDLNSRQWLLDARRKKGQGQRGHVIEPLFCPYAVMNGLIGKVRKANRLNADTAWRTLEHKFSKVYAAFESHDNRDRTGD